MEVTQIRRENLRELAKSVGGISKLAVKLHKSQSQISHIIGISPLKNWRENRIPGGSSFWSASGVVESSAFHDTLSPTGLYHTGWAIGFVVSPSAVDHVANGKSMA